MTTMNISSFNINGVCQEKCKLNIQYNSSVSAKFGIDTTYSNILTANDTTITAINTTANIKLISINQAYQLTGIYIVCPSSQLYNGQKADAEVIIKHSCTGTTCGADFYVCIPVLTYGVGGTASQQLSNIINDNTTKFNLNAFILHKYFTYYQNDTANNKSIVVSFMPINAINITEADLSKLKLLTNPQTKLDNSTYFDAVFVSGPKLFESLNYINETADDGIFIDCTPVSYDGNNIDVDIDNSTQGGGVVIDPIYLWVFLSIILIAIISLGILSTFSSDKKYKSVMIDKIIEIIDYVKQLTPLSTPSTTP
jgi:carbonic anhydrase